MPRTFSRDLPFVYCLHNLERLSKPDPRWPASPPPLKTVSTLQAGTPCPACSRSLGTAAYRLTEPYLVSGSYQLSLADGTTEQIYYSKHCSMDTLICYGCASSIARSLER